MADTGTPSAQIKHLTSSLLPLVDRTLQRLQAAEEAIVAPETADASMQNPCVRCGLRERIIDPVSGALVRGSRLLN